MSQIDAISQFSYISKTFPMGAASWILVFSMVLLSGFSHSWDEDKEKLLKLLVSQVQAQQLYIGEKIRSDGHSGLKQVRLTRSGLRPYHTPTHSQRNVASTHNHGNNIRTVGLGEFVAVMNGEEFRTRHNDYSLVMPSTKDTTFHETEPIPFPEVPSKVLEEATLDGQVTEMREWFKAWATQNHTVRDYRQHFPAVLCYLEGAWVYADIVGLDGFDSDRHYIDADNWVDLNDKIRFTSESGRKDSAENYAFLPTKIVQYNNGTPTIAQWNYRILCHPLKDDLPLNRMRPVEDLTNRLAYGHTWDEYTRSPGARFQINIEDSNEWDNRVVEKNFLDTLMEQIPGKDNYPADLIDDAMGETAHHLDPDEEGNDVIINTGYYHRWFKVDKSGAMGSYVRCRGFSDENLFMAMTTNEEVVPSTYESCTGHGEGKVCTSEQQRWTYAFPLEINYLTPLSKWNYFNVPYRGDADDEEGKAVTANGRDGSLSEEKAYNGTNSRCFYFTPREFFEEGEPSNDPADTILSVAGVLDSEGIMRELRATGMRIFLPVIPGLGELRQRYQVMPIHGDGLTAQKELEALKDIVMDPVNFNWALRTGEREQTEGGLTLRLEPSKHNHTHLVFLRPDDVAKMKYGKKMIWLTTEKADFHEHRIKLYYNINYQGIPEWRFDQLVPYEHHPRVLTVLDQDEELSELDYYYDP